jgi:hypothetical protein
MSDSAEVCSCFFVCLQYVLPYTERKENLESIGRSFQTTDVSPFRLNYNHFESFAFVRRGDQIVRRGHTRYCSVRPEMFVANKFKFIFNVTREQFPTDL